MKELEEKIERDIERLQRPPTDAEIFGTIVPLYFLNVREQHNFFLGQYITCQLMQIEPSRREYLKSIIRTECATFILGQPPGSMQQRPPQSFIPPNLTGLGLAAPMDTNSSLFSDHSLFEL